MFTSRKRLFTAAISLAAAFSLSGCGAGGSSVDEAMGYLPADATTVTFVDQEKIAKRLGIDDLETGASTADLKKAYPKIAREGYGTELATYLVPMQKAAFSDLDVEWEAVASGDLRVVVWKLNDDVDFDKVAGDLEKAGFDRSGGKDQPTFKRALDAPAEGGLIDGRYPAAWLDIALVPDKHLVMTGDVETGLKIVDGDKDSVADKGDYGDLLDRAPAKGDLEYVAMTTAPRCASSSLTQSQIDDLNRPDSIGLFIAPDEDVTVARTFKDDANAKSEAKGFDDFLDAADEKSGLDVDFDVERDGNAVLVEADFKDRAKVAAAWQRVEGPFMCAPKA